VIETRFLEETGFLGLGIAFCSDARRAPSPVTSRVGGTPWKSVVIAAKHASSGAAGCAGAVITSREYATCIGGGDP